MIPLHPQRTDRPDELRWHLPPGTDGGPGHLLQALLDDGTLAEVRVERDAVLTRLAEGRDWWTDGPRVRTALHAAPRTARTTPHTTPHTTLTGPAADRSPDDEALRTSAQELLAGQVADLARSHGGRIDLAAVHDGIVEVTLQGACHGCPAARATLTGQLEGQLRARHPSLRAVRPTDITRTPETERPSASPRTAAARRPDGARRRSRRPR